MTRRIVLAGLMGAACALLALGAVACGDDDDDGDGGGNGDGGPTVVEVTLKEFEVVPASDSAPAGSVTFRATNDGPEDAHELVVIKTDLAPDELPTDDTGKVDEEQVDALGEIEEFAVGGTEEITLDLDEGSYVLICNILEELDGGETESHYLNGMRKAFTVE